MGQRIDRWGALPNAGGLRDQYAGDLNRAAWATATNNAYHGHSTATNIISWIDSNQEAYELYAYVKELLKDGD